MVVDNLDVHPIAALTGDRLNFKFTLYYCSDDIGLGTISSIRTNANLTISLAQKALGIPVGGNMEFTGQHNGILTRRDCLLVNFLCVELTPSVDTNPSYSIYSGLDNIKCIDISTTHTLCDGKY